MAIKNLDSILEHYRKVAPFYDDFFQSRYDTLASAVVREFDLQPDDCLVDFGAGTGTITHLCWKKAGLSKPALAVDPSKELLEIASKLEGVETRVETCKDFIESSKEINQYNKFMFCRCFHHVVDQQESFFKTFYQQTNRGSKLMIIEQLEDLLWEDVRKKCREVSLDKTVSCLESVGFTVTNRVEHQNVTLFKREYFEGLRNRVYSVLELCTDEEIEEGIAKLNRDYFGDKESIQIDVETTFLIATKKSDY